MKLAFMDFVLDPRRPGSSGLSDIVWSMGRELARLGNHVHIVGPYSVNPELAEGIAIRRFELPPIGYRNIIGHALIVLKMWNVVRRIPGLDLIHAPEYLSTGIVAPSTRVPVTLTTPGNIYERIAHGNPYDWSTTFAYKLTARSSARACALIHAISVDQSRWWQYIGASPARTIAFPLGVDFNLFHRRPDARSALGLSDDELVVLYVGRLSRDKNVRILLHALALLASTYRRIRLHLVGTGPERAALERLARELSVDHLVHFEGQMPLERIPYWYSACNVCVLPSTSEPLGRVMLEAMACGTVFIGAAVGGIVDHVRHGINGYLLTQSEAAELAQIIDRSLSDTQEACRIGAEAVSYARENFDWKVVVQRFQSAIEATIR